MSTNDFPNRLESKLQWSPAMYDKLEDTTILAKPRYFTEDVVEYNSCEEKM